MTKQESGAKRNQRPRFIWPLILILVGILFLLNNLGLMEEGFWRSLWRLWPVIFVAIGLDSLFRRNEIAGPVFMIGLGIVFLLSSVGIIGWGAWDILWRLWPIILVAVGIELIVGRRSIWVSLLVVSVFVAGLAGLLWIYGGQQFKGAQLVQENINQALSDIDSAEISIRPAVGDLSVGSLTDSENLIRGRISSTQNKAIISDYWIDGTTGYFTVESRPFVNFPGEDFWRWTFQISDQIPVNLELSIGAGNMDLEFLELDLSGVDISQGVGKVTVSLPGTAGYQVNISQAIGAINILVPEDVNVVVEAGKALSSLSLPAGYEQEGDRYYSPNYGTSDETIELDISQAIGSIQISD